jgi:hypothetical protein
MTARETTSRSPRMHRHRAALLLAAIVPICLSGAAQACEKYGPVALTGTLSSLRVSGPPGYGQTPRTDAVETIAILQMSPPLCVDADPADLEAVAEANIATVQLVGPVRGDLTGTNVTVTGTLVHASSPDHRTSVIVRISGMEQILTPVETISWP